MVVLCLSFCFHTLAVVSTSLSTRCIAVISVCLSHFFPLSFSSRHCIDCFFDRSSCVSPTCFVLGIHSSSRSFFFLSFLFSSLSSSCSARFYPALLFFLPGRPLCRY
ncbi:hypothetical protein K435DRAFT_158093 [Dendrothele bispora CBS 962.96]|uniref:Secreted peptide n=1 Tax=Dendrothele bispora (strain CBS 962.96) TaxID=1314807 RepID=A0A4S8KLN8_DENBC|nr:hypothetical protein K435DRAFT_158093 [Dendrothele bispora CBS 962.96]